MFADSGLNNLVVFGDELVNDFYRLGEGVYWRGPDLSLTSRYQRLPECLEIFVGLPNNAIFTHPGPFELPTHFSSANAVFRI